MDCVFKDIQNDWLVYELQLLNHPQRDLVFRAISDLNVLVDSFARMLRRTSRSSELVVIMRHRTGIPCGNYWVQDITALDPENCSICE